MVPTAPPPPSPVREKGYASSATQGGWWQDLTEEQTPELRWPLSLWVYDRMRKQDAQVSSVLRAVTSPIIRTQTRVDGSGCRDEVTQLVADNLGLPIVGAGDDDHEARLRGRDRFSWKDHKRLACLMLPFGHMFFEQVYRYVPETDRYWIRKLGPRLPKSISRINVASDGGLLSIQQWGLAGAIQSAQSTMVGNGDDITLPVNRLVAYVLEREGGNWRGQSLLRSAYKNWLLKDRALRTWFTSIDRNGTGIPIYTGAPNEADLEPGQAIAEDMRSGDNAGAAIPDGAKIELLGVTGQLPDIDAFVRYQDEQIARAVLAHVLNLGTQKDGQVGSYNLGTVLKDTFHLALETIDGELLDTANAHVVEDLVDINFGSTEPAPRLVDDPIGISQTELDRVREAAGLSSDADLVKLLRTIPTPQEATA